MVIKLRPRRIIEGKVEYIECPRCHYDYHRIKSIGMLEQGYDPNMVELECGRCNGIFYVTSPYIEEGERKPQRRI